jgi:hypothetical protein
MTYESPGNDHGIDVAALSDQSVVAIGYSDSYGNGGNDIYLTKTDANGALLWSHYYGGPNNDMGYAVAVDNSDNIYITGSIGAATTNSENIYIAKISSAGNLIWTKNFGGAGADIPSEMLIKNNKVYIIGSTTSIGAGQEDIYLICLDLDGNTIQEKTIGTSGRDFGSCICKSSDGNLIIGGRSSFIPTSEVFVAKIDLLCDTIWTKRFDCNNNTSTFSNATGAYGITELSDGNIMAVGWGWSTVELYSKTFHMRLDQNGNQIYTKYYGYNWYNAKEVISASNGGYILSQDFPYSVVKFDQNGDLVWSKLFQYVVFGGGYQESTLAGRIFKLPAGKILVTGTSFMSNGTKDLFIAKIDSNGQSFSSSAPVITINGSSTICTGDSVQLSVPAGYTMYRWWYFPNGNAQITVLNSNINTCYVKAGGNYFCVMTKATGTRVANKITIVENLLPSTSISSSAGLNFCAASGISATLSAVAGYTSYQWLLNGVSISGATANTYIANSSGAYSVTMTNGCGTTTSSVLNINAQKVPTATISCSNCSLAPCQAPTLSCTTNLSGVSYLWYNGSTAISNATNSTFYPYTTGNYSCVVTNACGSSSTSVVPVGSQSIYYDIDVPGYQYGCGNGPSYTLLAPYQSVGPYQWYYNGTPISGATASSYLASNNGVYKVSFYIYTSSMCGPFMANDYNLVIDNSIRPSISAPNGTSACLGSTLKLVASHASGGVVSGWYRNGSIIVGGGDTLTVNSDGQYNCIVYNSVCGNTTTNSIQIVFGSPVLSSPSTSQVLCAGASKTLSCGSNNTTNTYQWFLNSNPILGATNNYYNTNIPGIYTCSLTNGCSTVLTPPMNISASTLQAPIVNVVGGNNIFCSGQTKQLTTNSGLSYYYWYRNGGSYQSGATLSSISTTQDGVYKIQIRDSNSCYSTSANFQLIGLTPPIATKPVSMDYPQICLGDTITLKAKSNLYSAYSWFRNGIQIAGTSDSIFYTSLGGSYSYSTSNVCSTTFSPELKIVGKANPIATITPLSATTFCLGDSVLLEANSGTGYAYEWYRYSNLVNGANSNLFAAKKSGPFKVKVTNKYGCEKTSLPITINIPCRAGTELDELDFNVYPNPSHGEVFISIASGLLSSKPIIDVLDIESRLVSTIIEYQNESLISIKIPSAGVYLVRITTDKIAIVKKVVVVN